MVYAGVPVPRPVPWMNGAVVLPVRPVTVPVPSGQKPYVGPGTFKSLVTGVTAAPVNAARAPAPK
jgi:hypothetical protein